MHTAADSCVPFRTIHAICEWLVATTPAAIVAAHLGNIVNFGNSHATTSQRLAAYFLLITILQAVPAVTITEGIPTQAGPVSLRRHFKLRAFHIPFPQLTFVLAFDGVLTALEDYRRHQDDARVNNTPTKVLRGLNSEARFEAAAWKDLMVGDIIKVASGEVFPADVLFLSATHDDPDEHTVCFVQTAQLDGETNLKLKKTTERLSEAFLTAEKCSEFNGTVEAGAPDASFSAFDGAMHFSNGHDEALYASGLLLRGTELRNCDFVHAMVMYTGDDTKVRVKANKKAGGKYGSIDDMIDRVVLFQVGLVMVMSIVGAIGFGIFTEAENTDNSLFYLRFGDLVEGAAIVSETFVKFLTFFLVTSNLVPISLYVSIRIARQTQRYVFNAAASPSCDHAIPLFAVFSWSSTSLWCTTANQEGARHHQTILCCSWIPPRMSCTELALERVWLSHQTKVHHTQLLQPGQPKVVWQKWK
jgi:hypothetical protein